MQLQLSYNSEGRGEKQKQDDRNEKQHGGIHHTSGLNVLFCCLDWSDSGEAGGRSNTIWYWSEEIEGKEKEGRTRGREAI
jgi:hypothetical protein